MRIKNIRDYRDKVTREMQRAGDTREVAAKRGKEIIEKGGAVEVKEADSESAGGTDEA